MFRKQLSLLRFDRRGNAAVEFALLLPFLSVAVTSLSDVANISMGASQMQTAIRASIQYVMDGGSDMSVAQQQGTNAWSGKPSDGSISVSEACECGTTAATCGTLCTDGSDPATYVTGTATGTLGGSFVKISKTVTQVVRVQ